jgi:hypothetical protein
LAAFRPSPTIVGAELLSGKSIVAYPNPAKESAKVIFKMDKVGRAYVMGYSINGDPVFRKDLGEMRQGLHSADLDLARLSSGIYFLIFMEDSGFGVKTRGTFKLSVLR